MPHRRRKSISIPRPRTYIFRRKKKVVANQTLGTQRQDSYYYAQERALDNVFRAGCGLVHFSGRHDIIAYEDATLLLLFVFLPLRFTLFRAISIAHIS